MSRYYIIYIFLFAIFSGTENLSSQTANADLNVADEYFSRKDYALAAAEYERVFYNSDSRDVSHKALQRKAVCYKLSGKYKEAATTLERMPVDYKDYYQISLCHYLNNDFLKAENTITKCELYFDSLKEDMLLIKIMTLNELNDYTNSEITAEQLATMLKNNANIDISSVIDSLYSDLPKFKNEKTAKFLAFIPGLAQIYAGEPVKGLVAFTLNATTIGFGIWQFIDNCYLTAYSVGAGMLSITYPGALRNGMYEVRKYNHRKAAQFNMNFKHKLISTVQYHLQKNKSDTSVQ